MRERSGLADLKAKDVELCILLISATMILGLSSPVKRDEPYLFLHVPPRLWQRAPLPVPRIISPRATILLLILFLAIPCLRGDWCWAQSGVDDSGVIRGVVINSVTREPISRALVSSPDNRFAALTDSEGRFEFAVPKADSVRERGTDSNSPDRGPTPSRPNPSLSLMARKPGFLTDPNNQGNNLQKGASKELTLALTPEALIVGTVALPTAEAPDPITLQVFRRDVQDGRAHWVEAGGTQSNSDGQFRFANLPAGTYKLLTRELLDRDPLIVDPINSAMRNANPLTSDPSDSDSRGPLFGYPPVYYQSAPDFGAASIIQVAAGQTQTVNLSLVRVPYYRVKVPVSMPVTDRRESGVNVSVYAHGHKGPGFSLGYNNASHAIEGTLPNGVYTVEASSGGPNAMAGIETISVNGGPLNGPSMRLAPSGLIPVYVREEFTGADRDRGSALNGPRRYLSVTLESADNIGMGRSVSLREPTGPQDEALVIQGAAAGSYWVRVHSSRGYAASVRSGNVDLQHRPLVVGAGGGAAPIEITMRDDTAEISGTVEGIKQQSTQGAGGRGDRAGSRAARVYCVPLPDSSGQFTEGWVHSDGTFDFLGLPPGTYRVLAFNDNAREFEYRNPEAMQAYESKGFVVRVGGGQKERVQLQLVSTSASGTDE